MKRLIFLIAILFALTGCAPPIDATLDSVTVISETGFIYRPLVGSGDDWHVQPGNIEMLDFGSGRDRYGDRTGLLDDVRWSLGPVTIQLDEKTEEDTVFWPSDLNENQCIWFPGWTATRDELVSGLPYPMYPLVGYPWASCQNHTIPVMPSQMATITTSARAEWIELEFELPSKEGGEYTLDLPGYTPRASNVLTVHLGSPQEVIATCTVDGEITDTWIFEIPIEWFWISGSWQIPVGPSGVCH